MTNALNAIYDEFTPGSQGFCTEIESRCGYEISRDEIERISVRANTPDEFERILMEEIWWMDGE